MGTTSMSTLPRLAVVVGTLVTIVCGQTSTDASEKLNRSLDEISIRSLVGRPEIEVATVVHSYFEEAGLTQSQVRDDIELILRRNGVPVVGRCNHDQPSQNCGRLIVSLD